MKQTINKIKKIEYTNTTKLLISLVSHKKDEQRNICAEKRKDFMMMPVEPKGYMKYKEYDPL